jgi:hypothetical protein
MFKSNIHLGLQIRDFCGLLVVGLTWGGTKASKTPHCSSTRRTIYFYLKSRSRYLAFAAAPTDAKMLEPASESEPVQIKRSPSASSVRTLYILFTVRIILHFLHISRLHFCYYKRCIIPYYITIQHRQDMILLKVEGQMTMYFITVLLSCFR